MKELYFAHPMDTYSTPLEEVLLEAIQNKFPDYHIENPNQEYHQEGCRRWQEETSHGMSYFYKELLPKMDILVLLAFEDNMIGAGVYGEANKMVEMNKPIYEISRSGNIEKAVIDENRKLSIEETKKRVH